MTQVKDEKARRAQGWFIERTRGVFAMTQSLIPIVFLGMTLVFAASLLGCSISDAMHK